MNKLVIPNGGMPLEGDDFRWMQDGYAEAFKGVMEVIAQFVNTGNSDTDGNFIISGCEMTNINTGANTADVTEGFVYIDGEILYTPAVTGIIANFDPTKSYAYQKHIYFDPSGQEVFQDSSTQETYEVRRAQLVLLTAAPSQASVFLDYSKTQGDNRYHHFLTRGDSRSLFDNNVASTMANSFTIFNQGQTYDLLVTKQFGRVNFRGGITPGTLGNPAFTIAEPYRPKVGLVFLCPHGADGIVKVVVAPNGNVEVYAITTPSSGTTINLDGINYTIE